MVARKLPDNCDGFNATFMCDPRSPDCRHGSCWHMDCVRRMVRRWFSVFAPKPRIGWQPPPEKPEPKLTKAERADMDAAKAIAKIVETRRADAFYADFHRRWWWVPPRLWRYRDTGGGANIGGDVDGVGSWGRHVRQWEDREDER